MRFSLIALLGAFTALTSSFPITSPSDVLSILHREPLEKPGFTPVDALSPLKKRAPTLRFINCTPEQQSRIRDALIGVAELCQLMLTNPIDENTLLYRRIFGNQQIGDLVPAPAGPVDVHALHATVVQNFQNLANINNLPDSFVLIFNCDEAGTTRKPGTGTTETANVQDGNQINLFPSFFELPTFAQMIMQALYTDTHVGPNTNIPLDYLRNNRGVLLHELLHVNGIGVNPQGNGVVLDRQIPSTGQTAYLERNVHQLAFENPALAVNNADSYRVYFDAVTFYHQNYFTQGQLFEYQTELGFALWAIEHPEQPSGNIDPGDDLPAYDADPLENTTAPQGTGGWWPNLHLPNIAGGSGHSGQTGDFKA